jgi:hypothetical protein
MLPSSEQQARRCRSSLAKRTLGTAMPRSHWWESAHLLGIFIYKRLRCVCRG